MMPLVVGWLGATVALSQAVSACAIFSYSLVLVAVALLPETRGKTLSVYSTATARVLTGSAK